MMINPILFRFEFRRNLRSLVVWSVIIGLLIFFTMSFFRTVHQYQQQIAGMIQIVPPAAIKMRGFGNITDMFNILGFYAANNIIYMMLLGSIFSIVLTSNIVVKEESGKTAEYLMSRPLTRNEIFFTKSGLALCFILLLNLFAMLVSFISLEIFREGTYPHGPFFILSFYTLLLNLLFGSLGLVIAVMMKRARPVTSFTVGLTLVLYFFYSISRMAGIDGRFGYISPFKWVKVEVLSPGYGLEGWNTVCFLLLTVILVALASRVYRKKDILT
jgi:ABC-2 type transport system permease protein